MAMCMLLLVLVLLLLTVVVFTVVVVHATEEGGRQVALRHWQAHIWRPKEERESGSKVS